MRKLQVLALSAVSFAVLLAGAASASAQPQASARPAASLVPIQHIAGPTRLLGPRDHGKTAGAGCGFTGAVPADRFKGLPDFTPTRAARPYIARLHTNQGLIVIKALTAQAPCTTFSLRFLAERRYFDRTHCHRLTLQGIFVLQCGDRRVPDRAAPGTASTTRT